MRFLFWKALIGLLAYDVLRMDRNFAKLHRLVSNWAVAERSIPPDVIDRVCQAVNYACAAYPKRVLCLPRSAVTTCLLRNFGISAQMVIGAQKLPFKAHAWTEVDGRVINERRDVHKFFQVWERC